MAGSGQIWATKQCRLDVRRHKPPVRDLPHYHSRGDKPADAMMILLVTIADIKHNSPDAFKVFWHISTASHPACSGPHIKYTNLRVPAKNVLCPPGPGASLVSRVFDCTAVLIGAMSVNIMRAAFDATLAFAKSDNRKDASDLLKRQAVADLLSRIRG